MSGLNESMFQKFPAEQEAPLVEYWKENKIFERSVQERPEDQEYVMFDGPPFATGLPHHGHLLAHTLKDVFPRYHTMKGKRVERVFGWDCHGVPVENIATEELAQEAAQSQAEKNIAVDIKTFNDKCRSIVLRYTKEWQATEERMGRWIDMDNPYMTMDLSFMESVWSTFKTLHEKGYIYRDQQVLDYSVALHTVLSKNEIDMKEVPCTTATVRFRSGDETILAWTTTPWTLPSNRGLAVHPDIAYVTVQCDNERLIVAKSYFEKYPAEFPDATVIAMCTGADLVGRRYEPLFPDIGTASTADSYTVIPAAFVEEGSGTGIVHIAPAFGEDDYAVGKKHNLEVHDPFDEMGMRNSSIPGMEGKIFYETDAMVLKQLETNGALFKKENILHTYPYCPRTKLPLMKRVRESWFFDVDKNRERALELAKGINWAPDGNAGAEFESALKGIEKWGLSRDRFWGTPIPMWLCEETGAYLCVGSLAELEKLSGRKVEDLHYDVIGNLTIEKDGKTYVLKRELFDCWFESGSMPYGQMHYPFENKERMEKSLPADFIAEGRDQTRLWFQKLHILSSALHDKPAFRNVVTNGIVMADKKNKMSKSSKNYKSPDFILENYGADALRFSMMDSPLARGERMEFKEDNVKIAQNQVLRPLWNVAKFFASKANADGWSTEKRITEKGALAGSEHILDHWLFMRFESFKDDITKTYEAYDCPKTCALITEFLNELSNWYVRLSRKRFFKPEGYTRHYEILHDVLTELSQLTAPIMPFISENLYRTFTGADSVHLTQWPQMHVDGDQLKQDPSLQHMPVVRQITEMGNSLRKSESIRTRQPLSILFIDAPADFPVETYADILADELNVKAVQRAEKGSTVFSGDPQYSSKTAGDITVALCCQITPELQREGIARDLVRAIQDCRKQMKFNMDDFIELVIMGDADILEGQTDSIAASVNGMSVQTISHPDVTETVSVGQHSFTFHMRKTALLTEQ